MFLLVGLQNVESRLKVLLPDDVGAALMDGVVLCHLANHIRPRSVASIHVPSPAVVSLTAFKSNYVSHYRLNKNCGIVHKVSSAVQAKSLSSWKRYDKQMQ